MTSGSKKGKRKQTTKPNKTKAEESKTEPKKCECPRDDEVIKSPLDPSDYRLLTLPNGLRAFLISTCDNGTPPPNWTINEKTGVFLEVEEFNKKHLNLDPEEGDNKPCEKDTKNCKGDCTPDEPENKRSKQDLTPENKNESQTRIPKTKKGTGYGLLSVAVGVGAYSDPEDYPGLAHLCEHACITFGSTKYPETSGFEKLISNCVDGYSNASTYSEFTTYFFQIDLSNGGESRFRLAVDMVANFINDPLLPLNEVQQEINSVDNEFGVNRECSDWSRLCAILHAAVDPGHPQGHFNCGNNESLNHGNLNEKLREWRKRHYAPNYTTLVIRAALPFDDLEQFIRTSFGPFPASPTEKPRDELLRKHQGPFDSEHGFNKLYKFVPIKDIQLMSVEWELPVKFINDMETKPLLFIYRHFEGSCSLTDYLRDQRWAYTICGKYYLPADTGSMLFRSYFNLSVFLTDAGLKCWTQVVLAIYSYLKMIAQKVNMDLFNEIQREQANQFHYEEANDYMAEACGLSTAMLSFQDHRRILISQYLITNFDAQLIKECLEFIIPAHMNIVLCSKKFVPDCNDAPKWINAKYCKQDFDVDFLNNCRNVDIYEEFKPIPTFNPFRIKRIDCRIRAPKSEEPIKKILLADCRALVSYCNDNSCRIGNVPYGSSLLLIGSPMIKPSPLANSLACLWSYVLRHKLKSMIEQATNAGITFKFDQSQNSYEVAVIGPSKHLTGITMKVLETFVAFPCNLDDRRFDQYKKDLLRSYESSIIDSATYMWTCKEYVTCSNSTMIEQRVQALREAKYRDFEKYMELFKDKMFIACALVGCMPESNAMALSDYIHSLTYRELPPILPKIRCRALELPLGEHCLRTTTHNPCEHTSRVINYYQFGKLNCQKKLLLEKLACLIYRPAFSQLRTIEHLSYFVIINHYIGKDNNALQVKVYPQPHRHTPAYVDERIDIFLANFRKWFESYDDVFASERKPDLSLMPMTADEHKILLDMFDEYLLPTGCKFRKISFQMVGHLKPIKKVETKTASDYVRKKIDEVSPASYSFNPSSTKIPIQYNVPKCVKEQNGYFITDIEAFKSNLDSLKKKLD